MENKNFINDTQKKIIFIFLANIIFLNILIFFVINNSLKKDTIKVINSNTKHVIDNLNPELNINAIKTFLLKSDFYDITIYNNKKNKTFYLNKLNEKHLNIDISNKKESYVLYNQYLQKELLYKKIVSGYFEIIISHELRKITLKDYIFNSLIIFINILLMVKLMLIELLITKKLNKALNFYDKLIAEDKSLKFNVDYLSFLEFNKIYKSFKKNKKNLNRTNLENSYKEIINKIDEGVILINYNFKIMYFNQQMKEYFIKIDVDQFNTIDKLIRNKEFDNILDNIKRNNKKISKNITLYDPKEIVVNIQASPIMMDNTEESLILLIFKNVNNTSQLDKLKTEFVENVTHELKTPVTIINGFLETIKNENLNSKQKKEFFDIISSQTVRISSIIDNLIFLTELEDYKKTKTIIFKEEYIKTIVNNAIEACLPKANKKNISIITININKNDKIYINAILFYQLLTNLLDNAIKYSEINKKIEIKFEKISNHIKIYIIDEGKGIEEKHLPYLFQRFYRIDKSRNRKTGGSGLGLSISKNIMEIHKGKISVTSNIDKGSTFICTLPIKKGENNE